MEIMLNKLVAFGLSQFSAIKDRANDKEGQALVEYALIIALIAVVAIVALKFLGGSVGSKLNNVGNNI